MGTPSRLAPEPRAEDCPGLSQAHAPPKADQAHLPFCQVMAGRGAPDVSQARTTDMPSITVLSRGPLVMLGAMPAGEDSEALSGSPRGVRTARGPGARPGVGPTLGRGTGALMGPRPWGEAWRTHNSYPCHRPWGSTQVIPVPTPPPHGETEDTLPLL